MASGKRAFFSEIPFARGSSSQKDLTRVLLILYKRWEARIRDLFLTRDSRKLLVLQTTFVLAAMADYGLGISDTHGGPSRAIPI